MQPIKTTRIQVFPKTAERSKSSLAMKYFFVILQVISGFDLGFLEYKTKCKRYMWKTILFLCGSSFMLIFVLSLFNAGIPIITFRYSRMSLHLVQYVLIFLSFLFMAPDKTYCRLHHDLESIDSMLRVRGDSYNVEMKLLISIGFIMFFQLIILLFSCLFGAFQCLKEPLLTLFMCALILILKIVHVVCASIFYAFYCRLRTVKVILSTERADYAGMRQIYKSIAEFIETYKSEFNLLILSPIVFNTIDLMFSIVFAVNEKLTVLFNIKVISVVMDLIHMFSAAICAEMVIMQVDGILIILHDKLLLEREKNRIEELQQLITYVSARRLKFRVYQVIPLDASLIGLVVNFCITYLIVIIQFSSK